MNKQNVDSEWQNCQKIFLAFDIVLLKFYDKRSKNLRVDGCMEWMDAQSIFWEGFLLLSNLSRFTLEVLISPLLNDFSDLSDEFS